MAKPAHKAFSAIIIAIIAFSLIQARAQEYSFRHLTVDDGLPTNYCWSVLKDSRGFIWISTRAGLCRYDGYLIKVFQYDPADSASLSDNRISSPVSMVEDDDGRLWIGTNNGLNRYDAVSGKFRRYHHDPADPGSISNNSILCVYKDRAGTLWVGTGWKSGLNRYHPETDQFEVFKQNPGDSTWRIQSIVSLYEDRSGIFWVGAAGGLYQFDRAKGLFHPVKYTPRSLAPGDPVVFKSIYQDPDGTLYFGTQSGYLTYDEKNDELVPFEPMYNEQINFRFLDIEADPLRGNQILWLTAYNLYSFNKQTSTLSTVPRDQDDASGLWGSVLKEIFFDEAGMLWIPGTVGVNILNPLDNQIKKHTKFGQKYLDAETFQEDMEGNIWIGTIGYLACLDQSLKLTKHYDSSFFTKSDDIFHGDIYSILVDADKNLWVGNQVDGLFLLENGKHKFERCKLKGSYYQDIPVFIYEIFQDSKGVIWIGSDPYGLYQHKKGELPLTHFHNDSIISPLRTSITLNILEDHTGTLWFTTTGNGLFCQTPELRGTSKFLNYIHDPEDIHSLSNNWTWSAYEDIFNNLWIATECGLNRYIREDNRFEQFISDNNPGANFIYDLTGDNKGNLWLTTENGLMRFNPYANNNKDVRNDFIQVMPFNEIWAYHIFKNKKGRIFVGAAYNSGKGFFSFYPDSLLENQHPPTVAIVDFKIRNEKHIPDTCIELKKSLSLRHNQNFFSFEFTALDFSEPGKNQYAYMLEGLEDDWIYPGNLRIANYTRVPPGDYVFRVKASNNDGYWNEEGVSIAVTIQKPPWKSWWAGTLYIIFISGVVISIIWYYIKRQQLKHTLTIKQIQMQNLAELDSMKSRFFANISHEFRTPLTLILGLLDKVSGNVRGEETKNDIRVAQKNAGTLYRLINQLLSLSKLEMGQMKLHVRELDIIRMVNGYVQSFESLAKQRGISLVFHADKPELNGYFDQDKIEKILYNLLSNAFKFTDRGGKIDVSVVSRQSLVDSKLTNDFRLSTNDLTKKCIVLSVSDTGKGIAPDHLPHIFDRFYQTDDTASRMHEGTGIGLALTKELVELHHGTIHVVSEEGKGSIFTISLPLFKEYYKEEEIVSHEIPALENERSGKERMPEEPVPVKETKSGILVQKTEALPIILIVEDNADLRDYIRGFLKKSYVILESGDGQAGFNLAVETIPDLIISDIMMPVMDGYQLCQKLKTDERTSHIPVILLTARAGTESRIEGLETGADDFITKPFEVDELLARIRNLIGLRIKLQERFMKNLRKLGLSQLSLIESGHLTSMDQQFLQKALRTVNENMSDPGFDVGKLSSGLALGRRQVHRKILALTGSTPNRFIRSVRLSRAAEMLAAKTGTITEIAFETGFNNLSYFAKSFREQYGVLPSEFPPENRM